MKIIPKYQYSKPLVSETDNTQVNIQFLPFMQGKKIIQDPVTGKKFQLISLKLLLETIMEN